MILEHYYQLIRHYRKMLITIIVSITVGVWMVSQALLMLFPLYTGTASVVMLPTEAELSFTRGWLGESQYNPANVLTQTHAEYLVSRPVAEKALAKMSERVEKRPKPTGWKVMARKTVGSFKGFLRRTYLILNSGKFVPVGPYEEALGMLMEGIDLEVIEGSYILQVSVTLPRAESAAAAANALAEAYVERISEEAGSKAVQLGAFFGTEIQARETALDDLADQEYVVREELGLLSLDEDRLYLMNGREVERQKLIETKIQRAELEAGLRVIKRQRTQVQRAAIYGQLENRVTEGERRLQELSVREEIQQETLDQMSAQLNALAEREKPLLVMARNQEQMERELTTLRERMVTVNLSKSAQLAQVRNINPARVPVYPSFPKVLWNTAVGGTAGVLMALFALVVIDTTSGTVKTVPDLRRLTGERSLGHVGQGLVDVVAGRKPLSPRADNQLQALGSDLERQMASLGAFDTPSIQVTGFGNRAAVSDAAVTLAAALAEHGATVDCRLPRTSPPPPTLEHIGQGRLHVSHNGAPPESPNGVHIHCVGPLSSAFRWTRAKARSTALVCIVPAGELLEETIEEFKTKALDSGLSAVSFVLLDR